MNATRGRPKRRGIRFLAVVTAIVPALAFSVVSAGPASAFDSPRPDHRAEYPLIAGTRVKSPGDAENQSHFCTVGAVLVPKRASSRISSYEQAKRWFVTTTACAPKSASVFLGRLGKDSVVGTVVWRSFTSDIELVQVLPRADNMKRRCAGSKNPSFCLKRPTYSPRADNRVFALSESKEQSTLVKGWEETLKQTFCTSGSASGVRCVWQRTGAPRQHVGFILQFADSSGANILVGADSGGPLVSDDSHLIGIVSSVRVGRLLAYTSMGQVLKELSGFRLPGAPAAVGKGNRFAAGGVDAGWELAPSRVQLSDPSADRRRRPAGGQSGVAGEGVLSASRSVPPGVACSTRRVESAWPYRDCLSEEDLSTKRGG